MVEKLFTSTRKQRAWLWRRASVVPPGLWIVFLVVALVFGRYVSVSGLGMHRNEIVAAYGSAGLLYGTPQSDRDGRRITFCQMSDQGVGVFLLNTATGQKHLIYEKLPLNDPWISLDVWPWSPDGNFFIYTHTNLFVCEAATRNAVAELPIEGLGGEFAEKLSEASSGVRALTWLNPEAFVYTSRQGNLHWFQKLDGGRWQETPSGIRAGSSGLTTLSSNTIAWQKGNRIWSLNLATRAASLLFESKSNHLTGFSYSRETGQFLLSCSDNGVDSLWRLTNLLSSPVSVPIGAKTSVRNVAWVSGGRPGCAWLSPHDPDHNTLTVQLSLQGEPVTLFGPGTVETFIASPDKKKLFIVGAISNEPSTGIWQYDVSSGELHNLVSYTEHPSNYARRIDALHGISAQRVDYYLYPPANFDRHKKYPLVIGDTLFKRTDPEYQNRTHGPLWAPMLANCGAYVVIVERDSWMNGIDQWGDRVMSVYEQLSKNPMIDTNRVFLFGTSLETHYLSELVENQPDFWNGIIFLNPSLLPDLSLFAPKKSAPKILISAGLEEGREKFFEQYQQNAGQQGIPVELFVHAGSGHWLLGTQSFLERCQAMEQFVFDH